MEPIRSPEDGLEVTAARPADPPDGPGPRAGGDEDGGTAAIPGGQPEAGLPVTASRWCAPQCLALVLSGLLAAGMMAALDCRHAGWPILLFPPLSLLWAFGLLDGIGAVLSLACRGRLRRIGGSLPRPAEWPAVAVLYPCCDDFQRAAVRTLLELDYPDFHVFVLDDSVDDGNSADILAFCTRHPGRLTYLRRGTRRHFKAGNLNAGVASVPARFGVFCVCDADERLPPGALLELLPWLSAYPRLAFVQALHAANPTPSEGFARRLGFQVRAYWRSGMVWRMWFGMPVLLGHGYVLRREALEDIGGFPECSSEDIRMTGRLRRSGWFGAFAEPAELPCEDVPPTLAQYRRRTLRWAKQDAGTAFEEAGLMLPARCLGLAEKVDWLWRNVKFPARGLVLPWWLALALVAFMAGDSWPAPTGVGLAAASGLTGLIVLVPLLVYALDTYPNTPAGIADCACTTVSISLLTAGTYSRALVSCLATRAVDFVPTGLADRRKSPGEATGTVVELVIGGMLLLGAVLSGQVVMAVIGAVVLAGATWTGPVGRHFPVLRWILPLALVAATTWDIAFGGRAQYSLLALTAFSALIG